MASPSSSSPDTARVPSEGVPAEDNLPASSRPPARPQIPVARPTGFSLGSTSTSRVGTRRSGLTTPEHYKNRIGVFSESSPCETLYSGEHYRGLAQFLRRTPPGPPTTTNTADSPSFVVTHLLNSNNNPGNNTTSTPNERISRHSWVSFDDLVEDWGSLTGNRITFLRGYPSPDWLCQLGNKLNVDYEFLHQHFSNMSQLSAAENYCFPPLSITSTDTIQLTFTSIGQWDNYESRIGLGAARAAFGKGMKSFVEDVNGGRLNLCDSVVRDFELHDLHHFSVEQTVSIRLLPDKDFWTILVWTDCGTSLSRTHRGPWRQIESQHSSQTRFLPVPLHYSNSSVKWLAEASKRRNNNKNTSSQSQQQQKNLNLLSTDGDLIQTLSFLPLDFGTTIDRRTAATDPFYALDEIFRLFAASEHQFLNLMAEKLRHWAGENTTTTKLDLVSDEIRNRIVEIQTIKRLIDRHLDRLHDVLEVVQARGGGPSWWRASRCRNLSLQKREHQSPSTTNSSDPPSSDNNTFETPESSASASSLTRTFQKLIRRGSSISAQCKDSASALSNDSVVREAQKSLEQAESMAKITFIAFLFVPLSFTTSIFGMNLQQLNESGQHVWVWVAVSIPTVAMSLLAWWLDQRRRRSLITSVMGVGRKATSKMRRKPKKSLGEQGETEEEDGEEEEGIALQTGPAQGNTSV